MNLAKYSLDNTKVIYFFLAVLLIGGVFSFGKLGKKEDAPFVIKSAVIMTRYPGAEPAEVERLITEPISREIQSMSGVYKIKSESMYGISKITFELLPSLPASSIPQKWDELRRKVLNIQPQLPSGSSVPTVSDDFGDVFGIYYGLTADDGFSYEEMRNWAERIKTQVVTADGVMKVALFGTQTEVVNISISVNKLAGMGIDPKQLAGLLQSQNQIINTGEITAGEQQLRVVANGMYTTVDDIRNQVITTRAGQVKLGDIAVIEKGYMDPPGTIMRVNGKRAIGIGVSTDPQRDVVLTGEMVDKKLTELLPLMPVGLNLESLYLENVIAKEANNGFIINLIESILIVIVIIMLVMGMRAGVLIGTSLVFSIGGTLLIMSFMGVGLNRTSLAGFIIAMGMLVDNAIVVTDNAQIAIARGVDRRKALIDGATGPQWGLLGATFIAICSFLPLYLAPSSVAEIVKPLFVVLAISLGLSWVLALTQTTVFGNFILKSKAKNAGKDPYDKPFYHKFEKILSVLIRRKIVTLGSMIVLFVVSLVVMGMMPQNFFPSLDKPYFRADVFYPDGYGVNDVAREMKKVEAHLLKLPEVKKVSITFGSTPLRYYLASTSVGPKPNFANVLVELNDSKYTKEYEEKFDVYMKANFPNAITRTSLFKLSPAVDAAIEIGFIGPNVDTLVALTNQALEIMHRNPDLINIRNSWGNKIPIWKPIYSPERAQPLGVSRQGMAQSIQIGTNGMTLGEFRQGDQVLPILLKGNSVADSFRINDLRTLPVFGNGPETTSLEQVVSEFDFRYRFSNVKDYNRQLVMMAQCDPRRGVNAIAAFNQIWSQVQKEIKIPEGYTLKYFGEQESQVESNEALAKNLPLTFFLMFTTLLLLFKTYRKPTVILLMLPLIFIGIVLGLLLLGKSFDFFAILGLLGLIGMNIKNAIVLVDQIDIENQSGLDPRKAVIKATISRIVPVAMASGTTILGMLPLLFDAMFGGMAATIMGGLLVASALTLFVLPVAYCAIHRIKG
ncbi:efflux RND transporter permease subunit [Bacteroides fragilis]|uniref:efflux RND transporter permease subunit n=1 Tax=Bacteroides fragilis TaxID=817 RepID=UPI0011B8534D|nr:efflux RND transporter permease subunit [Bacteroides fragilis]KAB5416770.1 efflux RND transporter permease subunit [Bacteroides fragilis]KAB5427079.1 efflux RND transporter permease subunit [Bacteroides fragilis]MCS2776217.1 efflux RND transporter permease subunit [Bacteroides fragilis]TWV04188.1 efflux RND transporter permease subunit [Bacteroides fragilis]